MKRTIRFDKGREFWEWAAIVPDTVTVVSATTEGDMINVVVMANTDENAAEIMRNVGNPKRAIREYGERAQAANDYEDYEGRLSHVEWLLNV